MKNFINKIKTYIVAHKIISVIILIVILLLGYWIYKKVTNTSGETRYVTTIVQKGDIVSTVSGTGQVSASSQVDLKAKTSGDIVYIGAIGGQKVSAGTLIAQIDSKEAQKSLRDAELNLKNAQISLEKLKLQNSNETINSDLQKAYDDGFSTVADAFLDLPSMLTNIENILAENNLSDNSARVSGQTAVNYRSQAEDLYYSANKVFQKNRNNFRTLNRNSSPTEILNIINETYNTTLIFSDTIKSTKNFVDYMAEDSGKASDYATTQNSLTDYTNTINSHLSGLSSAQDIIKSQKENVSTSSLDIQSSELSVQQKLNSLQDLKEALADYYVRAPFDGTIANVSVQKADSVSSGSVIASIITKKQIAEIPFNEVDVAKVSVGQKASLTFDAISDLTISGEIAEIDSVGTVSSGVVNYNVKISFDVGDERIKPGMSVSAIITTNMVQDTLFVPSSAVKTRNGNSYVEIFDTALLPSISGVQGSPSKILPRQKPVVVGISDDTSTQIISGIKEGDIVVTKIIAGTTKASATPSILSSVAKNSKSSSTKSTGAGGPPPGM